MELTPSRIRHKKLAEKYVHYKPDQKTLDKNFNKFLQDTHNKLKKDESEFLNNVKKYIGTQVGYTDCLSLKQQNINRKIINKYKLDDEQCFNKYGNAVLNNSKKIKNYLTRKNKTDNDDNDNENKINDGELHIDNWKQFLKE